MKKEHLEMLMGVLIIAVVWLFTTDKVMGKVLESRPANSTEIVHKVVIDPGHGGIDPGMVGVGGIKEKDINLLLSMTLKEKLLDAGYEVVMTRESDEGLYDENAGNKKHSDLKKRCEIIEEFGAEIVVCIHQNSFSDSSVFGPQVFYYKHSASGKKLAQCIENSILAEISDCNERPIKADTSYYMLVHTPCTTVIVECGFITNEAEAKLLLTEEYREEMANAICNGVTAYFEE